MKSMVAIICHNYEYEQFLHDYDESYDNDIETEEIDYSEQPLLFSKSRSNCWHMRSMTVQILIILAGAELSILQIQTELPYH